MADIIDYYKNRPFEKGKLYNIGIYKGVYDGWSCDFGSFIFEANDKTTLVHPKDYKKIEEIKLI